jgi:hypothetical protein
LTTFGFDRVYGDNLEFSLSYLCITAKRLSVHISHHVPPARCVGGKRVIVKIVSLGGIAVGKLLIVSVLKIRHRVPKHQDKHGTKIWGSPVSSLWCEHAILGKT